MAQAVLTIDLSALRSNWRSLNNMTGCETAAVVKADGYGCDSGRVASALLQEGARTLFVAQTEEGIALRKAVGPDPAIYVFSGHMEGDTALIRDLNLCPMINSIDQMVRHVENLPGHAFGIQLDTGMNRLGMEDAEWTALRDIAISQNPVLLMSHLACADDPDHDMNPYQLANFRNMTDGINAPRSLSATGGILLGADYHFDMTRPGIGLYGGMPFWDALPVIRIDVPVIQIRDVLPGESVGYGNTWIADYPTRVATIAAGYADGILRGMGPHASLWAGDVQCPVLGRISMDMIAVDVTACSEQPDYLELTGPHQSVDTLADWAGTIGYEILTSLGARYARRYIAP